MDEEGIALVLSRASELRSKITNCIHSSSSSNSTTQTLAATPNTEYEDEEEETESLISIRDSLEALEAQLSSLQDLQQQQWYEKEASLSEIDYSRKKLLQKIKAYKGEDLEVIHEATAFASSAVEMDNNDLLLPPYPTRPTSSIATSNGYLSHFTVTTKIPQNDHSNGNPKGSVAESKSKRLGKVIGAVAKTVFTFVGFVAAMRLSGFEPRRNTRGSEFKVLGMDREHENEEKTEKMVECPPGKVMVIENGGTRCLVKERVEIPFKSDVTLPDVSYGWG